MCRGISLFVSYKVSVFSAVRVENYRYRNRLKDHRKNIVSSQDSLERRDPLVEDFNVAVEFVPRGHHLAVDERGEHLRLEEPREKRQMLRRLVGQKRSLIEHVHAIPIIYPFVLIL